MCADRPSDVLLLMLADILSEAETVRLRDPVRAAHLDNAADDLCNVLAEREDDEGESPAAVKH